MRDNGRSDDHVKRMFTTLRRAVSYGTMIGDAESKRTREILSLMRIKSPKTKQTEGTPEQISAIVAEAQKAGLDVFVLGWALQWWFALRAVDVRGQWLDTRPGEKASGIMRNGKRWVDGLTWDMIDPGVTRIRKTISKTEKTSGVTRTYDLTEIPEVRERLLSIPPENRVGPVIVNPRSGLPYTQFGWAQAWSRCRKAAGVPNHVKNMGTRAAAATHGERSGASPFQLRDALTHSDVRTTNRYIRSGDEAAQNVLRLRRKG